MMPKTRGGTFLSAALLAAAALAVGPAPAADQAGPKVGDEFTKQDRIYRSRGSSQPGGYVTDRSLEKYEELLPSAFPGALKKLGPKDRWLDIGAGSGQAILDYYASAPRGKAHAVAISIEDRRSEAWHRRAASLGDGRIRYLHGKRMREYTNEELGKFRIVTDVYGGFSYTDNLSLFLDRVLQALEVKGSFYTMVQSVHLEDGKDNPRTWYLTELVDEAGRDVKVCTWLKGLPCVKVSCESKSDWEAPTELIHVQKVCDRIAVPPMKLLEYEAGQPPGRRFRLNP